MVYLGVGAVIYVNAPVTKIKAHVLLVVLEYQLSTNNFK